MRKFFHLFNHIPYLTIEQIRVESAIQRRSIPERILRRRLAFMVMPAQQTSTQAGVGHNAHTVAAGHREHFLFELAVQQVVGILRADQRRSIQFILHGQPAHDLPCVKVAQAHVADLAILHQLFHGAEDLFLRRGRVGLMQQVNINIVRLQTFERFFYFAQDMIA